MTHKPATAHGICHDLRSYIADTFLPAAERNGLRDDDDLLQVLNSLQLLRMVIEIESRYVIAIDNSELTPENLGTINNIARFVTAKRA
jgi:acyl carrier protein